MPYVVNLARLSACNIGIVWSVVKTYYGLSGKDHDRLSSSFYTSLYTFSFLGLSIFWLFLSTLNELFSVSSVIENDRRSDNYTKNNK